MLSYPSMYTALASRVGVYTGGGAAFHLRSAGRGFFAEFHWPGVQGTVDVILLGVGTSFYLHHDINVFELGFRPAESEVGEVVSLRYAGQLGYPPGPESFAVLRFRGDELTYTLGLFGPRAVREWVLVRQHPGQRQAEPGSVLSRGDS